MRRLHRPASPQSFRPKAAATRRTGRAPEVISAYYRAPLIIPLALALLLAPGCSVRKMAINAMADSLSGGGAVYATDGDLELIRDAMPFGLKTIEGLLEEVPRHRGLLVTAASGFTQYAYLDPELKAQELEAADRLRARQLRLRAKGLYLRGRGYGVRALELRQPDFLNELRRDARQALAPYRSEHVEELYWTALSWAGAIAADKNDMDLVAELHLVEPIIRRCLELDGDFDGGGIHEFLIAFEGGRSEAQGGSLERARQHFQRARELSGGRRLSVFVSLAENVSVAEQNPQEFHQLLEEVLAFSLDRAPEFRLANLVAQRRARFLLDQMDEYFPEALSFEANEEVTP